MVTWSWHCNRLLFGVALPFSWVMWHVGTSCIIRNCATWLLEQGDMVCERQFLNWKNNFLEVFKLPFMGSIRSLVSPHQHALLPEVPFLKQSEFYPHSKMNRRNEDNQRNCTHWTSTPALWLLLLKLTNELMAGKHDLNQIHVSKWPQSYSLNPIPLNTLQRLWFLC